MASASDRVCVMILELPRRRIGGPVGSRRSIGAGWRTPPRLRLHQKAVNGWLTFLRGDIRESAERRHVREIVTSEPMIHRLLRSGAKPHAG
jgi:hypothetical protein